MTALDQLTQRQRGFVLAYLENPNGAEAARTAGYSAKTAKSQGSRLLQDPRVQEALEELRSAAEEESGIRRNEILAALQDIVLRADESDSDRLLAASRLVVLMGWYGDAALDTEDMRAEICRRLMLLAEHEDARVILKALDQLSKVHGLYTEKRDVSVSGSPQSHVSIMLPDNGRNPELPEHQGGGRRS